MIREIKVTLEILDLKDRKVTLVRLVRKVLRVTLVRLDLKVRLDRKDLREILEKQVQLVPQVRIHLFMGIPHQ